jgi:GTP-binding protein EngB required for normal cell division
VSDEMRKILEEVGDDGVTGKRSIRLYIKNPNVPCLDLVDMPGLVATGDCQEKTEQIIKNFINSEDGKNALFLAVANATQSPKLSLGMRFISPQMQARTFGVFTQCDRLRASEADEKEAFRQWVLETDAKKLDDIGLKASCVPAQSLRAQEEGFNHCKNDLKRQLTSSCW